MPENDKVMRIRFRAETDVLPEGAVYWTPIFYASGATSIDPNFGEREEWRWYAQGRFHGTVGRDVWLGICLELESVMGGLGLAVHRLEKKLQSLEFSAEIRSEAGESLLVECEWVNDERLFEYRSAYREALESFEERMQSSRIERALFKKATSERERSIAKERDLYIKSRPNPHELEVGPVLTVRAQLLSRKSSLRTKLDDLTQAIVSVQILKDVA